MSPANTDHGAEASKSERVPPRERFAAEAIQLDLRVAAKQLEAESNQGKSGHRQVTLYKHDKATIALFRFEKGGSLPQHLAKGTVIIQAIEGSLSVSAANETHRLDAGGVLVLAPGVRHDVEAKQVSLMLLTVCLDA